mmetsp:Transcript_83552/g.255355  ORF Transcript_83552/g.255355 Transcript_83552/m.255355 type:complete len:233 (-) Transcript_83552:287-985(-)
MAQCLRFTGADCACAFGDRGAGKHRARGPQAELLLFLDAFGGQGLEEPVPGDEDGLRQEQGVPPREACGPAPVPLPGLAEEHQEHAWRQRGRRRLRLGRSGRGQFRRKQRHLQPDAEAVVQLRLELGLFHEHHAGARLPLGRAWLEGQAEGPEAIREGALRHLSQLFVGVRGSDLGSQGPMAGGHQGSRPGPGPHVGVDEHDIRRGHGPIQGLQVAFVPSARNADVVRQGGF